MNCTPEVRQRNWGQFSFEKDCKPGSGVWGEGAVSSLAPVIFVEASTFL